jgi:hypothetical protein
MPKNVLSNWSQSGSYWWETEGLITEYLRGTILLTSCLSGLDYSVLHIKTKIVSCHTADSKPVKQEVNGTMILPLLVFLHLMVTQKGLKFPLLVFKYKIK